MKVRELLKNLQGLEDFDIVISVRKPVPAEELAKRQFKYPYDTVETDVVEFGDIGYSDNKVSLDCIIK